MFEMPVCPNAKYDLAKIVKKIKQLKLNYKLCHHLLSQVIPNMYMFLMLNTKDDILKNAGNQTVDGSS